MDFHTALNSVIADITPQPWTYTDQAGTTLTVIAAGLPADPGTAEVLIRITRPDATGFAEFGITTPATKGAAEIGITTAGLPALITALENRSAWEHEEGYRDPTCIGVTAALEVTVTEGHPLDGEWVAVTESMRLPEAQRLPLASALRRALDVARTWED